MPESPTKTPTSLVVDDNAENRALAEATLEDEGYATILASGGVEALEAFDANSIDCVLLDVRMPGMDGFEVCRRIRQHARGANTPVVFLTALRDLDTFDTAQTAGGDDFLTKPVQPVSLALRVKAALKLRSLGAELREHYDLVRRQRDDLMRLQLQKERLMEFVVHDLKNPVNSMDINAQLLARDSSLSPKAHRRVEAIRQESRALLRLILNLLDLTRSDEGNLSPAETSVALSTMVSDVVSGLANVAAASGVSLESNVEAESVVADPDLLRRLLDNLVDNAIRHSPDGTSVAITTQVADGDSIEIRVSDQGSGIPPAERDRIFERHVRLDPSASTRTGRGLGLAFCKAAAEAHGGSIRVAPSDVGATFCVRLPNGGQG